MTWTEEFSNSFVKGVGKTTGIALVFGMIGGLYYLYTSDLVLKKRQNTVVETDVADVQLETVDAESIKTELSDKDEAKFKRIFDF